jgi:hypothetical protein
MADLGGTALTPKLKRGNRYEQSFVVTVLAGAQTGEWLETGFAWVDSVSGYGVNGATDRGANFVLNAQGTDATAGSSPGAVGIEATGVAPLRITVVGR